MIVALRRVEHTCSARLANDGSVSSPAGNQVQREQDLAMHLLLLCFQMRGAGA
jgi:hypothetical protein